jgi:uncharacterized membrane protein YphA (DoxX/SURF4 family)
MLHKLLKSDGSNSTILIRMVIGFVFISEGLQKFILPEIRGVGRFINIGIPYPEISAYFVASFEIVCGALVLIGLMTRLSSIPILIIMIVAIMTTKIEVFTTEGMWSMLHGSRTDWAMLICSIFLIIKGSGDFSADYIIQKNIEMKKEKPSENKKESPDIYSSDYFYS